METVQPNKEYSLNELALIKGAFDRGNKYKYVGLTTCVYTRDLVYTCNGKGIYDNYKTPDNDSHCSSGEGDIALFIKVADTSSNLPSKTYWDGKSVVEAGMWVQTSTGQYEVLLPIDSDGMIIIMDSGEYIIQDFSGCTPVDQRTDREKAIADVYRSDLNVKGNLAVAYDKWVEHR